MILVTNQQINSYKKDDITFSAPLSNRCYKHFDDSIYTLWMRDSLPKRYIFWNLYNDLLKKNHYKVLDIGAGFTSYTPILRDNCKDYRVCDILAHDQFLREYTKDFLYESDWFLLDPYPVDIVIVNDLFPNADQRLEVFIDKFIPYCKEIRITITFYNQNRFYVVQRLDAEEKLVFQAYNGYFCKIILNKYKYRIGGFKEDLFNSIFEVPLEESVYPNKRHVVIFKIKGDLV